MPRLIAPGEGEAIDVDDLVEALETSGVDPRDEDGFAALGPWLARLGRNRRFLADLAIAELERGFAGQQGNGYGPQVLMLRPPRGRFALRANFWPARGDAVVRAAGTDAFFYDLAHDHNFSFLTYGYLGPGYWSDYYRFDGAELLPGDPAGLVFEERARLEPGRLMLYRAHRDVHVQWPPDAFSVSLNVLGHAPGQAWRSQYRFDVAANRVAEELTVQRSEALLTIAVATDNGVALAADLALRHPAPRMRRTALSTATAVLPPDERRHLLARAADDPATSVARVARARLAARA